MPLSTLCPNCQHSFRVPDKMAGRPVRCPRCEKSFTAGAAPPASSSRLQPITMTAEGAPVTVVDPTRVDVPPAEVASVEPAPDATRPAGRRTDVTAESPPPAAGRAETPAPPAPAPPPAPAVPVSLSQLSPYAWAGLAAVGLGLLGLALVGLSPTLFIGLACGGLGLLVATGAASAAYVARSKGLALALGGGAVSLLALVAGLVAQELAAPPAAPPEATVGGLGELRHDLKEGEPKARADAAATLGRLGTGLPEVVADLAGALEDPEEDVRRAAAASLGRLGPPARLAHAALLQASRGDSSRHVREAASAALTRTGKPGAADLPFLLEALKARPAACRAAAAAVLGKVGAPDALPAAEPLHDALKDEDPAVRVQAAFSLWLLTRQADAPLPVLLKTLQEGDVAARSEAANALGTMRAAPPRTVPALAAALQDRSPRVRARAAAALWAFDLKAAADPRQKEANDRLADEAADALRARVRDEADARARLHAAQALQKIKGPAVAGLVGAFADLLGAADPDVRVAAAVALEQMGKDGKDAAPALLRAMSDEDLGVRLRAVMALAAVGPDPAVVLAPLTRALTAGDDAMRARAAYALAALGPRAGPAAAEEVRRQLKDRNPMVRVFAAQSLWAIERRADDVMPIVLACLQEPRADVCKSAAEVCGAMGPAAREAVGPLCEVFAYDDKGNARQPAPFRAAAAKALGDIGPAARAAYPLLFGAARADPDEAVRDAAAGAVERLGRPGRGDVPGLIHALQDKQHPTYRAAAASSLWLLDRQAAPAVSALAAALHDEEEEVRKAAAAALAALGPAARPAVGELRQVLQKGRKATDRALAAHALGAVGPEAKEAIPDLERAVQGDDVGVKLYAARALLAIRGERAVNQAVRVFIEVLQPENNREDLRAVAAESLVGLGPKAAPAVGVLTAALGGALDREEPSRRLVEALAVIGPPAGQAVPELIRALQDADAEVRAAAADALNKIAGPAAERRKNRASTAVMTAFPALLSASRLDPSDDVRRAAQAALTNLGEPGADDVAGLVRTLTEGRTPEHRVAAAKTLAMIGTAAQEAIDPLGEALRNRGERPAEYLDLRVEAANALGEIGAADPARAVRALSEAVARKGDDAPVRVAAANALASMGKAYPAALAAIQQQALAVLQQAKEDADADVRLAAEQAYEQLRPRPPGAGGP